MGSWLGIGASTLPTFVNDIKTYNNYFGNVQWHDTTQPKLPHVHIKHNQQKLS